MVTDYDKKRGGIPAPQPSTPELPKLSPEAAAPGAAAPDGGPPPPAIYAALAAVMAEVTSVPKHDRNEAQGFSFRGVDATVNAVGPALRKHGVVVIPRVLSHEFGTVEVGQRRTPMSHAIVKVVYTFYATDGSSIAAKVLGEAMDSGDKCLSKAMSVAFRTALIQALALPTGEPDPDESNYERSPEPSKAELESLAADAALKAAKNQVAEAWKVSHDGQFDKAVFKAAYEQFTAKPLDDADVDSLRSFRLHLTSQPAETTDSTEEKATTE
jgi:hypothetical protein